MQMICLDAFQSNKYLFKILSVRIKQLGKWKFSTTLQILHAVRYPGGMHKNAFFRGCNIFVAMLTMNYCYWWKAVLTNKNLPKM